MAVTMSDVAKRAGVSIKTVSNVLNDYEFLRPSTKEKVLLAISELGYETNLTARSLRSGRTGMLGLVVADLALTYYAELASRLMTVASDAGYRVLVEQTAGRVGSGLLSSASYELNALTGPLHQLTDGMIHIPLAADADSIYARRGGKPLVLLGEQVVDPRFDLVTMKNTEAAQVVTQHLIETGRKRIVVIGARSDDVTGTSGLRLAGYRKALAEHNIAFDPHLVVPSEWRKEGGKSAIANLLETRCDFDAVFGLNDDIALGAMHELQAQGVSVPGQVAVCGFDDIEGARFASPALTTIAPGVDRIAEMTISLLLQKIGAQHPGDEPAYMESEFELKIRASSSS